MASVDAASKREDDLISGEKPPQLLFLENRVETLRQNLRDTVAGIAAAAKQGDRARVDNLSIRRSGLRDDLKNALDDIQKFEIQFNVKSTIDRRLTDREGEPEPTLNKPPQLVYLENRAEEIRKNLRDTVAAIATAAKNNERARVDNLSIRRAGLRDDLKAVLDDILQLEAKFNVKSTIDRRLTVDGPQQRLSVHAPDDVSEEPGHASSARDSLAQPQPDAEGLRLHQRLASLRSDLHDTVAQLAKAASSNDMQLKQQMSDRRARLKEEMKLVQDEYQMLTRESLALPPTPIGGTPPMGSGQLSASSRASMALPPRVSSTRPSLDRATPFDDRDRSNSRSSISTDASRASMAHSIESNSTYNLGTREHVVSAATSTSMIAEFPMLSGVLMKHPSHSNERGLFGNMSLRGVRERYCVLDGSGSLKYYKRKGDREPRGSVPLDNPALEVVYAKTEMKSTEFSICTPTHQNRFVAKTRNEMMQWVKALEATHTLVMQRVNNSASGGNLRRKESVGSSEGDGPIRASVAGYPRGQPGAASGETSPPPVRGHQHRATLGF
ncbi:hypothetical protein PINS_up001953 [Pythium insidiosum]|nr:hypothetical protein PINS_up001953 [Pythium insidiosum]